MAPKLVLKCPPPPPILSSPPPSLLQIVRSSSTANPNLQLSGKVTMNQFSMMTDPSETTGLSETDDYSEADDLSKIDEFVMWEYLEAKKQKVVAEKKRLEAEIERLEKCQMETRDGCPDGYRAQAVSTFYEKPRQAYPPVHRCPTEVEANIHHFPVVRTSIELLKVVLHTMISTIFFSRELLPLSSFGVRDLPICFSDEKFSFEDHFLNNGAEPEEAYPLQLDWGRVPVMERNRDKNTDDILDHLENKFVESLMKRELLGLQFIIVKDAARPLEVYETYTISIDYSGSRGCSDRRGEKPDFHDPMEDYKSSVEIKKAILDMFRHIYIVTNKITTLPEQRCLIFHTFHTPWAPESKNGDEFDSSWDDVLAFPTICGWRRNTVSSRVGSPRLMIKSATLNVTFINSPESNEKAHGIPTQMPTQIQFRGCRLRDEDMEWAYGTQWVEDELDERAAAKEIKLEQIKLEKPTSEEPTPEEPTPEEPTPKETAPEETAPEETAPEETAPEETTPEKAATPERAIKRDADEEADEDGPRKKAKTA
ncbi:DNA-binding HORMA [Penicillium cataractarum]|uniref:DNA-binding HORMA n=1 Tax=Penicillium cataractarum TaxID=2100454 RepID=A0A9W9SM78_9EURO|nr:DNA-binding HORMA [Penicillium cataractarum]KAJ5379834.1 DNA-binding HORMA [Penicillium cataractarum]